MTNEEKMKIFEDQVLKVAEALTKFFDEAGEKLKPVFEAVAKAAAVVEGAQDATEAAETHDFREGELIVYVNGDTFQIGEIKRLCDDGAFVWYHEGDTASKTPFENMHKLQNAYCIKQTSFALDRPNCRRCKNFEACVAMTGIVDPCAAGRCEQYTEE